MVDRISSLRDEASAAIAEAPDAGALEELRVRYLGRKSELTSILRGIAELDPSERGPVGAAANAARQALEVQLSDRAGELGSGELDRSLEAESIDVSLPGSTPVASGRLPVIPRVRPEI